MRSVYVCQCGSIDSEISCYCDISLHIGVCACVGGIAVAPVDEVVTGIGICCHCSTACTFGDRLRRRARYRSVRSGRVCQGVSCVRDYNLYIVCPYTAVAVDAASLRASDNIQIS